jgi:hypothetical protein
VELLKPRGGKSGAKGPLLAEPAQPVAHPLCAQVMAGMTPARLRYVPHAPTSCADGVGASPPPPSRFTCPQQDLRFCIRPRSPLERGLIFPKGACNAWLTCIHPPCRKAELHTYSFVSLRGISILLPELLPRDIGFRSYPPPSIEVQPDTCNPPPCTRPLLRFGFGPIISSSFGWSFFLPTQPRALSAWLTCQGPHC